MAVWMVTSRATFTVVYGGISGAISTGIEPAICGETRTATISVTCCANSRATLSLTSGGIRRGTQTVICWRIRTTILDVTCGWSRQSPAMSRGPGTRSDSKWGSPRFASAGPNREGRPEGLPHSTWDTIPIPRRNRVMSRALESEEGSYAAAPSEFLRGFAPHDLNRQVMVDHEPR